MEVNDKVIVVKDLSNTPIRKKYVGNAGVIVRAQMVFGVMQYAIAFTNLDVQKMNANEGVWYWRDSELKVVKEDCNIETFDVENGTIYVNHTKRAIAYVLIDPMTKKKFVGKAKCMEDDTFNVEKGAQIAMCKAGIKLYEYYLKVLSK